MKKFAWVPFFLTLVIAQDNSLFFSEYAEGSSNNKYLEIYNGTGGDIDLANYAIVRYNNGSTTSENLYALSGTLINGAVYVIANADADATSILPHNDDDGTNTGATWFNGDDYLGLIHDSNGDGTFDNSSEVIDVIGLFGEDPGSGWDVAGVTDGTKEHTLVRKSTVTSGNTDWSASAGTTADNSEWIVLDQNTWDYVGSHPHTELEAQDPALVITSPESGSTLYSTDVTVSFTVSNFTVATSGGDGHVHYAVDGATTVMQYTTDDIALTGLSESSHTVIVWLVDNSHANLSPHVADTVAFTVSPSPDYITIAEARALAVGTDATVRGIVTTPNYQTTNTEYGLQDATAGIIIFRYGEVLTINVGDSVEVTGELDEYNGKFEIVPSGASGITIISQNNSLPAFQVITVASLVANGEDYESELIKISNALISSGSWPSGGESSNLTITDDAGTSTVTMRIDSDTDIDGQTQPQEPFNVQGIAGQFTYSDPPTDGYQMLPRYYTDFSPAGAVAPTIADITMDPTSPTDEDNVTISATVTDDSTVASVTLTYDAGSGNTDVAMSNTTGDTYAGTIPAQSSGTTVTYTITAVDNSGNSTESDEGTYTVLPSGSVITSIYDIQYVSDPTTDDASPLDGQTVTISGVVTAEFWGSSSNRYLYVQDAEGPWNGVVCFEYDGWDTFNFVSSAGIANSVAEGDSVTVTGTVDEYYNLTEIVDVTDVIVHGPAVNMISPAVVTPGQIMTGGSDAEAYEGCLVKVDNVTVDNADLGNGEWSVTDGTNSLRVDDIWDYYYFPDSGQALAGVAGVMTYTYSNTKLEPRLARDVVEADGTPVRLQRIQQVLHSDLIKAGVDEESDMSYMIGDTVTIEGIVTMPTGLSYAGDGVKFIFQDEQGGPWSSILSYDPDSSAFPVLFEGDRVQCTGYVYEYSTGPANMTELFITEPVNILEVGVALPDTADVNTGDLRWPTEAEQWGTVMVRATNAIVIQNDLPYGEWSIDDGTGKVNVDDDSDSISVWQEAVGRPPVGSYVSSIRGWVYHHYGSNADSTAYKIEPLYVADIEFGAGPPSITDVSRDPCVPGVDDLVTVSADIVDNSTISEAYIYYREDGGDWNATDMSNTVDDTWSGSIPASGTDGAFIEYFVKAADDGADQSEIKWSEFPDTDNGNYLGYNTLSSALTINNIQYSPWPNGESPYNGCDVTVTGVVTGDTAQYNSGYAAYAFQSAS
ncbi:uncharacterized protein METZ01_LOCUS97358, partial [marine metagenome]